MNGRRDDDDRADVRRPSDVEPAASAVERDLIAEVLREDPDLTAALEALPAALDPALLPSGAWDRLSAALVELGQPADDEVAAPAGVLPAETAAVNKAPARRARSASRPPSGWDWAHPLTWLSAAAVAAAIVGLGTWGALQAGERARLVDEQRVLAYWMANPDLKMVALQEIGGAAGAADNDRLGVVCILPDGRALLLQPTPAARGTRYVVVSRDPGSGADAQAELGSGTGNLIRFDLAGAEGVVVMVASADGRRVPIAWAAVN